MRLTFIIFTLGIISLTFSYAQSGSVGIGTSTPHPSAGLDVNFTDKGFLPPRMTNAQRNAIVSPAEGLMIYNTSTQRINYFNGTEWNEIIGTVIVPPGYPSGFVHCDIQNPTLINEVINPATGKTWMDRNLGASQVATTSTDAASFGDLYQWGRFADGHQCRNSTTTNSTSTTDQPGHGNFILPPGSPYDWRNPQNENLWQGLNGTNNPCPEGYRLPTQAELNAEWASWNPNYNASGAFGSPLKLPLPGYRNYTNGSINPNIGGYWSSTVGNPYSYYLEIQAGSSNFINSNRALGFSVRCIKN